MKSILFISISFILGNVFSQSTFQREKINFSRINSDFTSYKTIFNNPQIVGDTSDSQVNTARKFDFSPLIQTQVSNNGFTFLTGMKGIYKAQISPKVKAHLLYTPSFSNTINTPYQADLQNKAYFKTTISKEYAIFHDIRGRVKYNANKHLELQAGIDNQQLGEGDRSLLFGNKGIPAPFAMMKASFWKFDYFSIHQLWREGTVNHYTPKMNATHYLNFNVGKKFTIGVFESVVQIMKDTLYNRGFEVEYLNPLIFYRPQEYSVGSSDNVLLGLNGTISWKNNCLYGQFVLDDINIQEIRNKSKWWANKYGIQAGYKGLFTLKSQEFFFRTELNIVTPFTYAAADNNTNYSNQGLPIAHPLGGNFVESFNELAFHVNRMEFAIWSQTFIKGNDPINSIASYGGDLYKSYNARPLGDFGYSIGVGERTYTQQIGAHISRKVNSNSWKLFAEPRLYLTKRAPKIESSFYIVIGLHKDFGSDQRNY